MLSNPRLLVLALLAMSIALVTIGNAMTFRETDTVTSPRINELAWMSGDWQTAPGGRSQIEEHWTLPAGGTMIGMGRTVRSDKTVEFEFLRIEQRGNEIFDVAHPNAQCPQTDFKLTSLAGQQVVFENPEHDFPKRITYRKNSDGTLLAKVDAGEGTKSQTFTYVAIRK
jgi:hypothetical protein